MTDVATHAQITEPHISANGASNLGEMRVSPFIVSGTDVEIANAVLFDLAQRYKSRIIMCEGQFHAFVGTHWRPLAMNEVKNAIYGYDNYKHGGTVVVKITTPKTNSVLTIMNARAEEPNFFSAAPSGINCASGFIEFDAFGVPCLTDHSPDHRQRHCLPGSWRAGAEWRSATLLNTLLQGCFGEDRDNDSKIALVSEVCGIAALGGATKLPSAKAIVLLGTSAANGKSELLAMLRGLLPTDAVCAIPPSRFSDERMLVQLAGRQLNACAELGTTRAIASETFKQVVTGDLVMAKDIYRSPVFFHPVAQHVFATNVLPPFQGGIDPGVERRMLVLQFNRTIPEQQRVPEIGSRIANEEADALLAFAVEGASRILQVQKYTCPKSSSEALREWVYKADPVLAWKERRTSYMPDAHTSVKVAYADFLEWAEDEGVEPSRHLGINNFIIRLRSHEGRLASRTLNKERVVCGLNLKLSR